VSRLAIIREWEAAGRPSCPVCGTVIEQGGRYRVSSLWRSPVHPYCLQAQVGRPTADSPALQDAARRAGLGHYYQDVPLRENLLLDRVRKFGVLGPDESVWDQPATWWEPPEYVTVNVYRTIREGRIVAAGIGGIADKEVPGQS